MGASSGRTIATAPWGRRTLTYAHGALLRPWLSYALIVALQLRVVWGVWQYKDFEPFDTAGYFPMAASWAHGLHDDAIWSPLYTNTWGTIIWLSPTTYGAAMMMHLVTVLGASVLVLAVLRKLLAPATALLIAAWWALLPPNFNVYYDVHLFGLLPLLVVVLLVARSPNRRTLGISLALLAATTLLMRNEMVIATALLAVAIVVHERRHRRVERVAVRSYALLYGVPLAVVLLLAGGVYWRSYVQGSDFSKEARVKHELNFCQVYAFNYQQRHPERFRGNAFTECEPLVQHDFRRRTPSFLQAVAANPRAMAAFTAWNGRLLLSGLQVALFGATATADQPDYIPVRTNEAYAAVLSVLALALLIGGIVAIRRRWAAWRREWLTPRGWAAIVLGAYAFTTLVVALTQRPRPEYMYPLTVGLMLALGLSAEALLARLRTRMMMPALAIASVALLLIAVPSFYSPAPRPLHDAVARLQPLKARLQVPGSVLVSGGDGADTCMYLANDYSRHCSSPSWGALSARLAAGVPMATVLRDAKALAFYVEPGLLADPAVARFVAAPSGGWRKLASGGAGPSGWDVLVRVS